MDRTTHPHFVPSDAAGSRKETAVLLVGTAREFDIPQRDIASTHNGFYISDALADVLDAEAEETGDEPEAKPEAKPKGKTPAKTSGNRAGKNEQE